MSSSPRTGRSGVASRVVDFWRQHHLVSSLSVGLMTEVLLATAEPEGRGRMLAVKRVLRGCVGEPLVESLFAEEANLAVRLRTPTSSRPSTSATIATARSAWSWSTWTARRSRSSSIATTVALDIGQLHLGRRAFLGVTLAGSSEPRDVPFDDVVCDALERYVSDRRSRIRSDGSNALFLWDQGTRLPAEVARAVMRVGWSG